MANCRCCHQPLHIYEQPSLLPGRPAHQLAECHTPGCDLEAVTRQLDELLALTPEEIDSYAWANVVRRARYARVGVTA